MQIFSVKMMLNSYKNRNYKAQVVNQFGAKGVSSFDYTYDELGRRTQRMDTVGNGWRGKKRGGKHFNKHDRGLTTNVFAYNDRSELISATMGAADYTYDYDSIGNRIGTTSSFVSQNKKKKGKGRSRSTSYIANELNQYTQITGKKSVAPSYDVDGNMLSDGMNTYSWNGENRLVQVSSSKLQVSFAYDYKGRRIHKKVYARDNRGNRKKRKKIAENQTIGR